MVIEQNYITCSQSPSWPEMITILEHKCFMFLIHQSMQESSYERSPWYFATRKGAPTNNQGDHPSAKRSDEEGAKWIPWVWIVGPHDTGSWWRRIPHGWECTFWFAIFDRWVHNFLSCRPWHNIRNVDMDNDVVGYAYGMARSCSCWSFWGLWGPAPKCGHHWQAKSCKNSPHFIMFNLFL